jgi:hypothetical protein
MVSFGADKNRGIYGNTPPEIIHTVDQGLIELSLHALYIAKSLSKKAMVRNRKMHLGHSKTHSGDSNEDYEDTELEDTVAGYEAPSIDDLIKNGAFGGVIAPQIDIISNMLGRQLQQQSDRDIPPCPLLSRYNQSVKNHSC